MKKQISILAILVIVLTSCSGPKLEEEQITKVLIKEEGFVGGISLNESKEDIKKLNPEFWEVSEEDDSYRLSKKWDDFNHVSISVNFSADKKVKEISLNFSGSDDNRVVAASIHNKLVKLYDRKFEKDSDGNWKTKVDNKEFTIYLNKTKTGRDDRTLAISSNAINFDL